MADMKAQALANLLQMAQNWQAEPPKPPAILQVPNTYSDPTGSAQATQQLEWNSDAAITFALAWKVTGDSKYADLAVSYLNAWATTCKQVSGFDAQLAMTHMGLNFVEAYGLLAGYPSPAAIPAWIEAIYRPCAASLTVHPNNPGAWGYCGKLSADLALGKSIAANLADVLKHIKGAVSLESGDLWREDRRTNSGIWYTSFALEPYSKLGFMFQDEIGDQILVSLRPAYQRLFEFVLRPDTWPHPLPQGIFGKIWRAMYPCADTLETTVPGRWPSGLYDTLSLRGFSVSPPLDPVINSWLNPVRPISEGCFPYSTLKYCYGLTP